MKTCEQMDTHKKYLWVREENEIVGWGEKE